jgi:hypothetical protein
MPRRRAIWTLLVWGLAVQPVAASDLVGFARCLKRAGATFYTASWCPHCARQSRMFGNAIRYLHVVDCTAGCNGVSSFPTWRFADGSQLNGVASFADLASRTRCRLGEEPAEEPSGDDAIRSSNGSGTRVRNLAGAQIIEVPRR